MPRSRLSSSEIAAIAASLGRSRQTLSRIKGGLDRGQARRLSVKLNIRVTEGEHAAFRAVAEVRGLTVSEAARHLVRQANDLLAIQSEELQAIAAARQDLAAVGNNLNQTARLGAVGRLTWNARDAALVRKVGAYVDDLIEEVVHLLVALRKKQGLVGHAGSDTAFLTAATRAAE
jgi:hypothetical protein